MATDTQQGTTAPSNKSKDETTSSESRRTMLYVVVAVAALGITGLIEWARRPAPIEEFGRVGQEFYADFTDPTRATSLEVYAFDADKVQPLDFQVRRQENGRWVIPSHHDYPADAEDQLAKTAASVIGIERGAMVTRWPNDHAQFGVVDPRQDSLNVGDVEGVGKRLILRGEDDSVLADYIIGDQVDDETGQYYVRHPDEDEVYMATLEIDLSTKFTDWINTDLLDVNNWDIVELTVNNYSFDDLQGSITDREVSELKRATSSDPWQLAGLDDPEKEVAEEAVRETINTVADLEVLGVRPKQKGLTPDLQLDRSAVTSQRDVDRLQSDLLTRGFLLQAENGDPQNLRLVAREGELAAATNQGLRYRLYFGRAFAGSQEELEIGLSSSETSDEEQAADQDGDEQGAEAGEASESESAASKKPGRYVFVRVEFDPSLLGDEPEKPVEPEKPAESDSDDTSSADADNGDGDNGDDSDAAKNEEGEEAAAETPDPQAEYEAAKAAYDSALQEYERESEEYQTKVAEAKEKAEEMNRRFAEWYYVIPGESFDKLRLSRADLVKPKEADDADPDTSPPAGLGGSGLPGFGGGLPQMAPPQAPPKPDSSQAPPLESESSVSESNATDAAEEAPAAEPSDEASGGEEVEAETPDEGGADAGENASGNDDLAEPENVPLDANP